MVRSKRVKRSEATWRELFARQAARGVSVSKFCRGEGINANVFRRWRLALNGSSGTVQALTNAVSRAGTVPFIDIGEVGSSQSRFEVRLDLGGGIVLSLARG